MKSAKYTKFVSLSFASGVPLKQYDRYKPFHNEDHHSKPRAQFELHRVTAGCCFVDSELESETSSIVETNIAVRDY